MSNPRTQDFGVLVNLAFAAFKDALEADLAGAGFDDVGASFGYVFRLLADGPCSLSDLAARLGISAPGALKIVEDMVEKGYVERRPDGADGRVKWLHLTARGRRALKRARDFHRRYENRLGRRLGTPAVAAARRVLSAMIEDDGQAGVRLPRPL